MPTGSMLRAKNSTGVKLLAGSIVYISGRDKTTGQPTIALASNNSASKMPAVGVIPESADNGQTSIIVKTLGACAGFDTENIPINTPVYDRLWLIDSINGVNY